MARRRKNRDKAPQRGAEKPLESGDETLWDLIWCRIECPKRRLEVLVFWLLLLACSWCFIGHGYWGVVQKPGWLPFFRPFSIPDTVAFTLMPIIGTMDISMGFMVLFYPCRALYTWMFIWTTWTAFLRPIAGLSFYEVSERGGNFGPPFILMLLAIWGGASWVERHRPPRLTRPVAERMFVMTVAFLGLLLIGHGGFGADLAKHSLIKHWAAIGIPFGALSPEHWVRMVGVFEVMLGCAIMAFPTRRLLIFVFAWKVFTELLYPVAGQGLAEFVERGGDYWGPMVAFYLIGWLRLDRRESAPAGAE